MSKQKKEKQPPVLGRLLAYAGGHKWLSVLGCGPVSYTHLTLPTSDLV